MNDLNEVKISGSLAREVEVRSTQAGKEWATFSLELKGGTDAQPRRCFVKCKSFGKGQVDNLKDKPVGTRVIINGRLEPSSYQNKAGEKVWTMEVYVLWLGLLADHMPKAVPQPPVEEPPF